MSYVVERHGKLPFYEFQIKLPTDHLQITKSQKLETSVRCSVYDLEPTVLVRFQTLPKSGARLLAYYRCIAIQGELDSRLGLGLGLDDIRDEKRRGIMQGLWCWMMSIMEVVVGVASYGCLK